MRTWKTLAALGTLLLVASSANATLTFTVHKATPGDYDSTQTFQIDIALSAGESLDILGLFWQFTGGTAVGPNGGTATFDCNLANPATMCAFGGMSPIVSNPNGQNWIWDSPAVGPVGPAYFPNIAQFTLTGLTEGTIISLNQIEAFDASNSTITDITVVPYTFTLIPEPTTVALLALGLTGLGLAGRLRF